MTPSVGQQRQGYASALAGVWNDLARTLQRLEVIAGDPGRAFGDENALDELPRLQYALHCAGELTYGIDPPAGAEEAHAELAESLCDAREATADIADAVEADGPEAAQRLVHEWRGALFRVRLARLRLAPPAPPRPTPVVAAEPEHAVLEPLLAFALSLAGALAFVIGATLGSWPAWAAGMLLVGIGLLVYRP